MSGKKETPCGDPQGVASAGWARGPFRSVGQVQPGRTEEVRFAGGIVHPVIVGHDIRLTGRVDREAFGLVDDVAVARPQIRDQVARSEEHTSELQSLMRISYAGFCLKKKKKQKHVNI